MGRLVQTWTSFTLPIAPERMISTAVRKPLLARPLVAHLRGDLHLVGHFPHAAGFIDRPGQRLLREAVLPLLHGEDAGRRVAVIGDADGHRVDLVAHLVEHFAIVVEHLDRVVDLSPALELVAFLVEMAIVDIAQRDDVAIAGRIIRVAGALPVDADATEIQLLERILAVGSKRTGLAHPPGRAQQGGILEKITTRRLVEHEWLPTF